MSKADGARSCQEPKRQRALCLPSDMILRCEPCAEIFYWGKPLLNFTADMAQSLSRPVANSLDGDSPLTLCPENGRGLFSVPGMEGKRDGLDWSPVFTQIN